MALLTCDIYSQSLGMQTQFTVCLPHGMETTDKTAVTGVLYLLHGLTGDHSVWTRFSGIERYVGAHEPWEREGKRMAVVMPSAARSFYTDAIHGLKWWTWISEELPELVAEMFPVSTRREDTYVAGLSMGGYGAFKLALTYPERFAGAASFSGCLDLCESAFQSRHRDLFEDVIGSYGVSGTPADLFALIKELPNRCVTSGINQPDLYLECGTEDRLLDQNQRFITAAKNNGLEIDALLRPGAHNWDFWDTGIRTTLQRWNIG